MTTFEELSQQVILGDRVKFSDRQTALNFLSYVVKKFPSRARRFYFSDNFPYFYVEMRQNFMGC